MADRRMFSKIVIDSDSFLDLPLSTQALYFHLSMRADDDGFIDGYKKIVRMIGASSDEIKLLLAKGFILSFENGLIVIRHWRLHNCIQKDRYKTTIHSDEFNKITIESSHVYNLDTECKQDVSKLDTQVRLDKISIDQDSIDKYSLSENPTVSEQKQNFEVFRKAFTGTKNGLDTEFELFKKKNKNYKDIIPLLLPAIERENEHREKANEIGAFFPCSKSLSVWLNKKCWEQELIFNEVIPKDQSKPLTDIKFEDVELFAVELIQENDSIKKDNFNKDACRSELNSYFNFVKSKNVENWKSAIRTMFNKNVNKFIYA